MNKSLLLIRSAVEDLIRQPFFTIMMMTTGLVILLSPFYTLFAFYETKRLLIEMGLVSLMMGDMTLASLSASHSFFFEIKRKTVLVVISKPVSRFNFLVSKTLAVLITIVGVFCFQAILFFLALRMDAPETAKYKIDWPVVVLLGLTLLCSLVYGFYKSYFLNESFHSAFVKVVWVGTLASFLLLGFIDKKLLITSWWQGFDVELIKGCLLSLMAVLLLASISIFFSLFVGRDLNIILTLTVFLLGMLSEYYLKKYSAGDVNIDLITAWIPKFYVFQVSDIIIYDKIIPMSYLLYGFLYSIVFQLGVFLINFACFSKRELS